MYPHQQQAHSKRTLVFRSTHSTQLKVGLFLFCFGLEDWTSSLLPSVAALLNPANTEPCRESCSAPLGGLSEVTTELSIFGVRDNGAAGDLECDVG